MSLTWLTGDVTTVAWCWRLNLKDGTIMGFTSHDSDLAVDGVTYEAATGFNPTAVDTSKDMAVDNMEVDGFLDSNSITVDDIVAGRFDFAEVTVFLCNWSNVNDEKLVVRKGTVGKITNGKYGFQAEIRGIMQAYQQAKGEVYQKHCRATLGDNRCKVTLATGFAGAYMPYYGKVTVVGSDGSITTDIASSAMFEYGTLQFTSGDNEGHTYEIKSHASGTFTLFLPTANKVSVGDTVIAYPGCDGNLSTCKNVYNNVLNFRGEPFIPGNDYQASYPNRAAGNVTSG